MFTIVFTIDGIPQNAKGKFGSHKTATDYLAQLKVNWNHDISMPNHFIDLNNPLREAWIIPSE